MKNTNVEAVKVEMKKILSDQAAEIETLQGQLDKDAEAITAAEKDMTAATDKGDLQGYQDAKSRRADAVDAKEMHESRMKRLTDTTLITESEYGKMKADIFAEMDANTETAKKKLKDLCDQIADVADDLREAGKEANAVLKAVQHDLYGNFDRPVSQSGQFIGRALEYTKHYDALGWASHCISSEMYKTMKIAEGNKNKTVKPTGTEVTAPQGSGSCPG